MGTTTSRTGTRQTSGTNSGWGSHNGGGDIGRDQGINMLGKDDPIPCQPWPECYKGDFLGKLGLQGKEARKGQKKR